MRASYVKGCIHEHLNEDDDDAKKTTTWAGSYERLLTLFWHFVQTITLPRAQDFSRRRKLPLAHLIVVLLSRSPVDETQVSRPNSSRSLPWRVGVACGLTSTVPTAVP